MEYHIRKSDVKTQELKYQLLAGQVLVSILVPKILNTDKEEVGKRRGRNLK